MRTSQFKANRPVLIGALLILPSVFFVLIGSSKFWAPGNVFYGALEAFSSQREAWHIFNLVSPIVFFGGALLALVINARPILNVNIRKEQEGFVGTLRVRLSALNLGVIVISFMLISLLLSYTIAENWQCILGYKLSC
jgi:hypothetical protein